MSKGGKGIERDSELSRRMSDDDLRQLNREEARQRLRTGQDTGEARRILEDLSGDKFEDLRDKPKGY